MPQRFNKDGDSLLDYVIDWSDWLDGDAIVTTTWDAETGIAIDSDTNTTTTTTVWLSGGTLGVTYRVTNTIVTAGGRTDERTIKIRVVDR